MSRSLEYLKALVEATRPEWVHEMGRRTGYHCSYCSAVFEIRSAWTKPELHHPECEWARAALYLAETKDQHPSPSHLVWLLSRILIELEDSGPDDRYLRQGLRRIRHAIQDEEQETTLEKFRAILREQSPNSNDYRYSPAYLGPAAFRAVRDFFLADDFTTERWENPSNG